jgi:hypothetical protein
MVWILMRNICSAVTCSVSAQQEPECWQSNLKSPQLDNDSFVWSFYVSYVITIITVIIALWFFSKRKFTELKVAGAPCDSGVYETLKLVCEFTKALCVVSKENIGLFKPYGIFVIVIIIGPFQFRISYSNCEYYTKLTGLLGWGSTYRKAPLPTQEKRTHTSMSWLGFKSRIQVL